MDAYISTVLWALLLGAASFGLGLTIFKRAYSHDVNALKQQVNILSAQLFNVKLALDDKSKAFTVLCTERDMQNIVIRQRGDEIEIGKTEYATLHGDYCLSRERQTELANQSSAWQATNKEQVKSIKTMKTTLVNQNTHVGELLEQVRKAERAVPTQVVTNQNAMIVELRHELQDALKLPANLQAEIDTATETNKHATAIIKNLRVANDDLKGAYGAASVKADELAIKLNTERTAHKLTAEQYKICKHDWDGVVGLWCTDRPNLIGGRFKSAFYRIGYMGEKL